MTAEKTRANGGEALRAAPGEASTDAPTDAPTLTRRDRTRLATTEEIKGAARQLLAPSASGGDLSLRAVAREIQMTPSAIYRYFESRQDLMESLAQDAFESVSATLSDSLRTHAASPQVVRVVATCHAYRDWCLAHPAEFALIFRADGSTAPGSPKWSSLAVEHYRIPFELFLPELGEWELPDSVDPGVRAEIVELLRSLAPELDLTWAHASALISVWSAIHGYVCLELFGHLHLLVEDVAPAYENHVLAVLSRLAPR